MKSAKFAEKYGGSAQGPEGSQVTAKETVPSVPSKGQARSSSAVVPNLWHQGLVLSKTMFPWPRVGGWWFGDDLSALYLLCTSLLLLLHQLYFRSSGIRILEVGDPSHTGFCPSLHLEWIASC